MAKEIIKEEENVTEGLKNVSEPNSTMVTEKPEEKKEAPVLMDAAMEAQITSLGKNTAAMLRKEQQVETMIPKDPLNAKSQYVQVGINGWIFNIKRNVWVTLPASVVDLLEDGGYNPSTRNYTPKRSQPFEGPNLKIIAR